MKNIRLQYFVILFAVLIIALIVNENDNLSSNSNQRVETSVNEVSFIEPTSTTSTSTTTTSTTTTSTIPKEVEVELICKTKISSNVNAKKGQAIITINIVNKTPNTFKSNLKIRPSGEQFNLKPVERGIRNTQEIVFNYEMVSLSVSGKDYYRAFLYDNNLGTVVGFCNFDRQIPETTTTTSTTSTSTTTTSTTTAQNFNSSTHSLRTLTGLENNPYLCEIPGTGIYENWYSSTWGRCAPYKGSVPNYDYIFIPAWFDGQYYVTEDPIWCFYDGEVIGCNVLDRIKRNLSIQRSRELILKSIDNLNNLIGGNVNSSSISPSGCKVYKTNNKLEADYIVGIESALTATYRISVVGGSLGTSSCGKWYIQDSKIGADFTIAYVDKSLNFDYIVDFVSSPLELP